MGPDTQEPVPEALKAPKRKKGKVAELDAEGVADAPRAKKAKVADTAEEPVKMKASEARRLEKARKAKASAEVADGAGVELVKMKASEARRLQKAAKAAAGTKSDATPTEVCKEVAASAQKAASSNLATVFVRGMSPTFDREAFKELFAQFGEVVELSVPMRKVKSGEAKRGREAVSRGIAFIQFASNKAAKRALAQSNLQFDGRSLHVSTSKAPDASADSVKDGRGKPVRAEKQGITLFVTNLPREALDADVKAYFRTCGNIAGCRILIQKGIAFIRYKRAEGVEKCLELTGKDFQGRVIKVEKASTGAPSTE